MRNQKLSKKSKKKNRKKQNNYIITTMEKGKIIDNYELIITNYKRKARREKLKAKEKLC